MQCHLRHGQWLQELSEPLLTNFAGGTAGAAAAQIHLARSLSVASSAGGDSTPGAYLSVSHLAVLRRGSVVAGAGLRGAVSTLAAAATAAPGASSGGGPSRVLTRLPSDEYAALVAPILVALKTATHDCGERGYGHYRSWHAWALVNFAAAEHHADNLRAEQERLRQQGQSGGAQAALRSAGQAPGTARDATRPAEAPASTRAPPPPPIRAPPLPPPPISAPPTPLAREASQSASSAFTAQPGSPAAASSPVPPAPPATTPAGGASLPVLAATVSAHAVAAVKAFFRSIALGRTRLKAYVLQDLLRLLTMWFAHGELPPVRAALESGLGSGAVSVEVWLQVIPQLIARIHTQAAGTRSLLHRLLERIGDAHAQALIYPLTVSCKSATTSRRNAAMQIMRSIRLRRPAVVDQAEMVSRELIRVAILWHEMWHAGLEEASRQYFGEGSISGMLATLLPLHEMISAPGPVTLRETAFVQAYGADLATAHRWLQDHQRSGRVSDLL